VAAVRATAARLRAHMDAEEQTFLAEGVLHDDLVIVGLGS
jgi:hypothetical protein